MNQSLIGRRWIDAVNAGFQLHIVRMQMTQTVTEKEIRSLCAEAGFPIADVKDDGRVLVLVPENLDNLPEASVLQQLADRIRQYQYRHVAFSVETD